MKTFVFLGLLLFLGFLLYAYANGQKSSTASSPAIEVFELHIGDRIVEMRIDEPVTVVTPGGEQLTMVLRRKATLHYAGEKLAFDYPSALQLSSETDDGITTLNLEGTASPFVLIQIYPLPNTAEGVLENLLEAFQEEYRNRQAQLLSGNNVPVKRTIGGEERTGRQLRFLLAGQEIVTELYAFPQNGAVVALVLQHDVSEAALAEQYFGIITGSVR